MPSRSGSVFSDNISTTSSQWTTTYKKLPKKQPTAIRFMSWAAGAPRGATVVKKRTRDVPDDQSVYSSWSTGSYFSEPDTQLYWVVSPDDRYYSSGSSSSGRSSRSSRSSGRKSSSSRRKHFNGAVPPPPQMMPPPPGGPQFGGPQFDGPQFDDGQFDDGQYDYPMEGHYPPPHGDMGGHFGGGGFPPPPPMTPMNPPPPPGGQPAFFNITGQHNPRGFGGPDDDWSETDSMDSRVE
ncbi:hypothetical protein B0T10DRAFT_32107 [Thelonectria olida]|uniref:Uncharacterized protein n=1 Tax=Thelonectria olida TaxID=1576542 RepID=A0A9P8WJ44_9HYPO|nr:hypothetical protein B0T10DRAFT_32107 [Thelonectria olida]